jgi:tetratricopeptide (TPR) repeat protein
MDEGTRYDSAICEAGSLRGNSSANLSSAQDARIDLQSTSDKALPLRLTATIFAHRVGRGNVVMVRNIVLMVWALAGSIAGAGAMAAGSGGGGQSAAGTVQQTPEQEAASHYKSGLRYKKRAWKQEEKAAKASTPEQRAKLLGKAAKNYEKAIRKQVAALKANERHHEAANELGYGLRRMGRYEQAIQWYDRALELQPGFLEAIEYRGEAYLATGNLDAAKGAYMALFRGDPALAGQLLTAMEGWLGRPGGDHQETAEYLAFDEWVRERKELAGLTQGVSLNQSRDW